MSKRFLTNALSRIVNLSDLGTSQVSNSTNPKDAKFNNSGSNFDPIRTLESIPAAAASIRFLTSTLARVEKRVVSVGRFPERRPDHWANALLRNPQDNVNETAFWRGFGLDLYRRGASSLGIERDINGRPIRLIPCRVTGVRNGNYDSPSAIFDTFISNPTSSGGTVSRTFAQSDIIRVYDDQRDPILGTTVNPLQPIGGKAYLTLKLYGSILHRFINTQGLGANAEIAITMEQQNIDKFTQRWEEQEGGFDNAGIPLLLEKGTDVKNLTVSDRDRQNVELLKFLIGEVSRIWSVPLFILQSDQQSGGRGQTAAKDTGEQFLHFISGDFGTTCLNIQNELNMKLLGPNRQVNIKFDVEKLTLGSLEKRMKLANLAVQLTGIWTPNYTLEELFDMPPVENGDKLRIPTGGTATNDNAQGGEDNDSDDSNDNNNENDMNSFVTTLNEIESVIQ